MSRFSIWDLNRPFRIKVIGAENVLLESQSHYLFVSVGLFHSGKEIATIKNTQFISHSASPRWYQWIVTNIEMRNIPRVRIQFFFLSFFYFKHSSIFETQETRVCFTLYSSPKKDDITTKEPLGWVNLLLFDYKLQLRTGIISLNLWNGEANPIGIFEKLRLLLSFFYYFFFFL